MATRQDVKTYVNTTMDREQVDPDGKTNQRFDTKTKIADDANSNDAFRGTSQNDYVSGGAGNDYLKTGKGDDHVSGGEGGDVIGLGRGDDKANGGDGNDFIAGNRGNDWMDGGDGDDIFGAVNGSNFIRTGDGNDTVVVTYRQDKMEARDGNGTPVDWADGDDAYTTIADFEVGADKIHLTGLREGKAPTKLIFDSSKDGTMITDQDGNKIVYLRDVQVSDPEAFIANSMDFGKFDWAGKQLETLMAGEDAAGKVKSDGSIKGVDLKDSSNDYGVFDFGENDLKPNGNGGQSFFHGSDGSLSAEAKALISGSSLSEGEVDEFVFALLDDLSGTNQIGDTMDEFTVTGLTADELVVQITNMNSNGGKPEGSTDTIVLRGEVVEDAIAQYQADTGLDMDDFLIA